jgi:hypothetical protein
MGFSALFGPNRLMLVYSEKSHYTMIQVTNDWCDHPPTLRDSLLLYYSTAYNGWEGDLLRVFLTILAEIKIKIKK